MAVTLGQGKQRPEPRVLAGLLPFGTVNLQASVLSANQPA